MRIERLPKMTAKQRSKILKQLEAIEKMKVKLTDDCDKLRALVSDLEDILNSMDDAVEHIDDGMRLIADGVDIMSQYL
jgi:hypothetical protein